MREKLLGEKTYQYEKDIFGRGKRQPELLPDLTYIWNKAAELANKRKISIFRMNKVWGALRTLEKEGFCKLADSTYD